MFPGKDKLKIGVLTTLYELDSAYSLSTVIESQLISLVKHGYKPIFFVHDNFTGEVPEGVEVRKVVPRFQLVDYSAHQQIADDFEEQAETAYQAFKEHLSDIDVIIEHDLIFQGWFLPYCVAIHKLAEETNIKWLHWTHSYPNAVKDLPYPHNLRYELPKNSKLVYLNNEDMVRVAEAYNVFPKDVRVAYNPLDPRLFHNLHPLVDNLIQKYDLLSADFMQTYPVSTPRMVDGKGLYPLIEVFAALKKQGKKVKLVVCNAHANNEKDKKLIAKAQAFAISKGLNASEVIYTSLEGEEYEHGVPREVVSQLFNISNVFVFPTTSENCSLILLEAMLSGNILVLNKDVPALKEFGKDNALYFQFGSIHWNVDYNDRDAYMADIAKVIISEMSINRPLKAQRDVLNKFNYDWVFKHQIEPLFYE